MRFKLERTSWNIVPYIKINPAFKKFNISIDNENEDAYIDIKTIEELDDFMRTLDEEIIVHKSFDNEKESTIELYDSWRE